MSRNGPDEPPEQTLGARIRAARQARRYTQSRLAYPEFSISYISAIERNQIQPSLRALEIIARRLDLSPSDLLSPQAQVQERHEFPAPGRPPAREEPDSELPSKQGLLEAHLLILQGKAGQAIEQLEELSRQAIPAHLQVQLYCLLGQAYLETNDPQGCAATLVKAERSARRLHYEHTHLDIQINNLFGKAYAAMHNYPQALTYHLQCQALLELAQPYDPFLTCDIYNQLGEDYMHVSDFDSAVTMLRQAIAIADKLALPVQVQSIYWDICRYYARTQQYDLAALYAHKYLHLYQQQVAPSLLAELYFYLGRALIRANRQDAQAYLEEALQQNKDRGPLIQAAIMICLAEWLLVQGNSEQAAKLAGEASLLAGPAGDSIIGAYVQLVLGRISFAQSRYEESNRQFDEAFAVLERLNDYDELDRQAREHANRLEAEGRLEEALRYYKIAFESKKKMKQSSGE